ncbi:hypothetical protein CcaverHIS002_0206290 [Cutaneotrichosporon cavernicola]|nr:hypothetical protein CcaverHIS002_0206290 [Cutaneotrichosporon cavernicola]
MPMTLDYGAYPHILEAVVNYADRAALLALRPVSSPVRALAEARLFQHVAVALDPSYDPPVVVLVEPIPPHRRLPFLVPKLHQHQILLPFATATWEASVRAMRIVDVHVGPETEALRHLIALLPSESVRLMRRRELGGRHEAEDVLTKLQAPTAVGYLDFLAKWPPQMTITSANMRRVVVHVPLEAMRYPWIIRPREGHGCREAVIVLDAQQPNVPPALAITVAQYLYHLVRNFFNGSGGQWSALGPDGELADPNTTVTVVGMERFRNDVPRALREIARLMGPDGEARLENHLVGMRYTEWLAREGEDAALERQPELVPINHWFTAHGSPPSTHPATLPQPFIPNLPAFLSHPSPTPYSLGAAMGSQVTLFIAPASRAGIVWFAAHFLITLISTTQVVAYIIRFRQVFPFQENFPLSYLTYALLECYLLKVATAIYQRRWHADCLSTLKNVTALAIGSVATLALVTFHPIVYYGPRPVTRDYNGTSITFNEYDVHYVSVYLNRALSALLALTALYTYTYVVTRPGSPAWDKSMCAAEASPSRLITLGIQAMHLGIFLISLRFAWAFLREGPRHVPQALHQLVTEPDARRALGEYTVEFIVGMFTVSCLWTLCTVVFVGISVLVLVYAHAVSRRRYDHALLKNKVHIPLVLLGIIPAWFIGDWPFDWRTGHTLDDSDRWNKSVYSLCIESPLLPTEENEKAGQES